MYIFFKSFSSKSREQQADLLCKITKLEQNIDNEEKFEEYDTTRSELEKYMIILQKVWKFVVNVLGINMVKNREKKKEKKNAICGTTKTLINDGKQITMPNQINLTLKSFYESLFRKDIKKSVSDIETF